VAAQRVAQGLGEARPPMNYEYDMTTLPDTELATVPANRKAPRGTMVALNDATSTGAALGRADSHGRGGKVRRA
jgi:hypothetical protein